MEKDKFFVLQISRLDKIGVNLKKTPYRRYRPQTIINKLIEAKAIYNETIAHVEEGFIHEKNLKDKLLVLKTRYFEVKRLLEGRLEEPKLFSLKTISIVIVVLLKLRETIRKAKMASLLEAIKTASTVMPRYDGDEKKLDGVIKSIKILNAIVSDENKEVIIDSILSKLDGIAKEAVGDAPSNLQEIIDKLSEKCRKKRTPEMVVTQLNAARQKGSIEEFGNEIERLTNMLEAAYISEEISKPLAHKKATKTGLKALADGMIDIETRCVIRSREFDKIADAVEAAVELDNGKSNTHVLMAHQQTQNRRPGSDYANLSTRNRYPQNQRYQPNYQQRGYGNGYNNRRGFRQNGYANARNNWHPSNRDQYNGHNNRGRRGNWRGGQQNSYGYNDNRNNSARQGGNRYREYNGNPIQQQANSSDQRNNNSGRQNASWQNQNTQPNGRVYTTQEAESQQNNDFLDKNRQSNDCQYSQ